MKKSTKYIWIIVVIVAFGIFWKITGIYINSVAAKRIADEQATVNTVSEKMVPDEKSEAESKPYVAIAPRSQWEDILKGEWELQEEEKNEMEGWFIKSDIEFKANKHFDLHTTIEYYDYESDVRTDRERTPDIKAGGKVSGTWRINSDGVLLLTSSTCRIDTSFIAEEDEIYKKKNYHNHEVRSCDYFQNRKYGTLSGDIYKMELKKFNQDEILVEGKNFATGAKVYYYFTKQ